MNWARRAAAGCGGVVAALALAAPALGHVEVEADRATAGAENAVLTFTAEAESPTAGIASVRVVLPDGIAAGEVALVKAPRGWSLTPGADGYTVAGEALARGADAMHSIRVARLPDADQLVFKALVTYADATVDRWIEVPSADSPHPDTPAAILTLTPNLAAGATSAAPTTATAPTAAEQPAQRPTATDDGAGANSSAPSPWWWLALVAGALASTAGVIVRRRARR